MQEPGTGRLPAPRDLTAPVGVLVPEPGHHLGEPGAVAVCVDLLTGASREAYPAALPHLTGLSFATGAPTRDPARWPDLWVRTWGARGLLYVWEDTASAAVVAGLADHPLPRVRAQALERLEGRLDLPGAAP